MGNLCYSVSKNKNNDDEKQRKSSLNSNSHI